MSRPITMKPIGLLNNLSLCLKKLDHYSYKGIAVGYQHRGSASRLVEDASPVMEDVFRVLENAYRVMEDVFRVLENAYRVVEDVFRVLEDVFRLNVSAPHQLVSAYRARVFAFFISCFENFAGI